MAAVFICLCTARNEKIRYRVKRRLKHFFPMHHFSGEIARNGLILSGSSFADSHA
jgi:hypothetical protein